MTTDAPPAVALRYCLGAAALLLAGLFGPDGAHSSAAEPISFNREIRPILSEHCWKCHGFDEQARQAGLRLDERAAAISPAESGDVAIVPGKPEASALIARLTTGDATLQMPPHPTDKRPTSAEIDRLKRWIAEGATYQRHWAFEPILKPSVPQVEGVTHPIDAFVAAQLAEHGTTIAPSADRDTLIRRVYFDLIGLPPTVEELELARRASWEATVDQLLASPHFGERMAVDWLDAARYADTDGYFGDKPRQMWLWRDWVIDAFNRNLPFDQFTVEQLAGDLLPEATISQRIATGFNRNHMTNDETGLIDEEYRVEYVADRVETTTATWLGLTVGCAQCHDHKYDPISQREYYQLFAFFNNVPEQGLLVGHDAPPRISVPNADQQRRLAELEAATAQANSAFAPLRAAAVTDLAAREGEILAALAPLPGKPDGIPPAIHLSLNGIADAGSRAVGTPLKPAAGIRDEGLRFDATQHIEVDDFPFSVDEPWTLGIWLMSEKSLGCPVSKIEPAGDRRGIEVLWQKGRIGVHLVHRWGEVGIEVVSRDKLPANAWNHVVVRYDGSQRAESLRLFLNGQAVAAEIRRDSLRGSIATEEPIRLARRDEGLGFYGGLDEFRWIPGALADEAISVWYRGERTRGILERPADKRPGRDAEWLLDDHIDHRADVATRTARDALRAARAAEQGVREAIPLALVMAERAEVRPTQILLRGVYNQPGESVHPGTPAALSPWPADAPENRLGLARWLMSADNPLVARVAVNRLWRQCFGEGLVRTANDFGTQGEPPTHPALLDFLAATYRDTGWDTKAMLRLIVTSQTYRQRSLFTLRDGEVIDPENRLLARGPRFRMPLEMIRDQALAASGLLVPDVGGPSVKPFQPPGLWEEVSYAGESTWEVDPGSGRYRRSLYTFHKRQSPHPALLVFDGPTREKCTLKRPRTNTPLQALVLLNDETYLEAARAIAATLLSTPATDPHRIGQAIRTVLSREPTADELADLQKFLARVRTRYTSDPLAARRFVSADGAPDGSVELAVWTVLVHTLFNLDEAITRR